MTEMTRREFVELLAAAAACALCPLAAEAMDTTSGTQAGIQPPPGGAPGSPGGGWQGRGSGMGGPGGPGARGPRPTPAPAPPTDIGDAATFAKDGIWDTWAQSARFYVVREGGRIVAVSSICSHQYGPIVKNPDGSAELKCTKHDGLFQQNGKLISGKPKKSLPHLAISKDAKGHLIVDPSKPFEEADWSKPEAFVSA